ncbi:DNA-3-methyladenine glycosylase I [Liquorilactobacillus aquaticus DSM 21051]|uniref:DNA-3-methyladenine glycosylase I n=1 Tax=Liquorilactobacillus aquaticus DSM 21051 TaxID=1423725 RepID=A0A0R2D0G6_9LACO|nr:DNA-3-methyladenine glycosylase I [Liquorilactobacillus aquaticus]KRM97544.1 DNA-3-methyladenine glycosylase I [Liquorilactobacillus aquaticus DSM 21051]
MEQRCDWALTGSNFLRDYHDNEWGKKTTDEQEVFEMLSLEIMQAGLNWDLVLKKRQNFRKAFDNFEVDKVAAYDTAKMDELCHNVAIIRNKRKITATINNAQAVIRLRSEGIGLAEFVWKFSDNKTVMNNWDHPEQVPSETSFSKKIASELQKKGFKFVGPTITYSFLQAIGIINDHLSYCEFKN